MSVMKHNPDMKTAATIGNCVLACTLLTSTAQVLGQVETSESTTAPDLPRNRKPIRPVQTKVTAHGISAAVTCDGKLLVSSNRTDWTEVRLGLRAFVRGITYGAGLFVAVGGSYIDQPGVILTSADGAKWTVRRSGTGANLYGVAHGNGIFVAVGEKHTVLTSKNGILWKRRTTRTSDVLLASVAFGKGAFVAVGDCGAVLSSTDAICWQPRSSGTSAYLSKVRFEAGAFVTTGCADLSASDSTVSPALRTEPSSRLVLPDL